MKATDWYARVLLTVIAGLLAYVATELRVLNQRYLAASRPQPALGAAPTQAYQPMAVSLHQPGAGPAPVDKVMDVRIVGYEFTESGTTKDMRLGTCYECATGLPVNTK